jgi:O-acetyl-ADP-ribose deacetylase (regulator of RNase III)
MPITTVSGDIFMNRRNAQAIAHGCNCQGSMGAGVAKGLRERYPEMFAEYRRMCKAEPRAFNLGDAWMWRAPGGLVIFNLGTQERFWHARASYEAIETAFRNMKQQADTNGIGSIAIPRIGTGYGGLSWKKVRAIVEKVFGGWGGTLYVYEEYTPEEARLI